MKPLMLATAAVTLTAAISLSSVSAAPNQIVTGAAQNGATAAPHYEWQYHYVGRHARYQGHWVLVQ